ncbi:MAG TPA: heme exporter protein CcmD [Candidatus Competibacteraceae bacterium]|nr:heme exporter protein CcmD [Candidatus Competibacteraceae bacterium]
MSFSSWQEFFHMGGYAAYVWSAYGITLAVLAWLVISPLLRQRRLKRDLARRQRRAQRQEGNS